MTVHINPLYLSVHCSVWKMLLHLVYTRATSDVSQNMKLNFKNWIWIARTECGSERESWTLHPVYWNQFNFKWCWSHSVMSMYVAIQILKSKQKITGQDLDLFLFFLFPYIQLTPDSYRQQVPLKQTSSFFCVRFMWSLCHVCSWSSLKWILWKALAPVDQISPSHFHVCFQSDLHPAPPPLYFSSPVCLVHRSHLRWVCAGGTGSVSVYTVNNSPLFPALPLSPPFSSLWYSPLPSPQLPLYASSQQTDFSLFFLSLSSLCPLNVTDVEVCSDYTVFPLHMMS